MSVRNGMIGNTLGLAGPKSVGISMLMNKNSFAESMRLLNLQGEPQRFDLEADRVEAELDSLVLDNYKIFVDNLTCSVQLKNEDKNLCSIVSNTLNELGHTKKIYHDFRDKVGSYSMMCARNRKTLQHHLKLVELLEIPQLVHSCIRNGNYDEVLELSSFTFSLESRSCMTKRVQQEEEVCHHAQESKSNHAVGVDKYCLSATPAVNRNVIISIADEVHELLASLRVQLLSVFEDVVSSLPKHIQTIGNIRKLDTLLIERSCRDASSSAYKLSNKVLLEQRAELQLQMDYIVARTRWYHMLLSHGGEKEKIRTPDVAANRHKSAYAEAIELVEITRTSLFTVVTHYNALFSPVTLTNGESLDRVGTTHFILNSWVQRQVNDMFWKLELLLVKMQDGSSIRSILEQCLYFASRMGTVGCDFTCLVLDLFDKIIFNKVTMDWQTALTHFKTILATEKLVMKMDISDDSYDDCVKEQVVPLYIIESKTKETVSMKSTDTGAHSTDTSSRVIAPPSLLSFPPLAFLLNSLLSGLSYIQECSLNSCKVKVLRQLHSVLEDVCRVVLSLCEDIRQRGRAHGILPSISSSSSDSQPLELANKPLDKQYIIVLLTRVLPHILSCYHVVYPLPSTSHMSHAVTTAPLAEVLFFSGSSTVSSLLPGDDKGNEDHDTKEDVREISMLSLEECREKGHLTPQSWSLASNCFNLLRQHVI